MCSAPAGADRRRVRGLGICDVLEVELEPEQIDGLIAEIDDLCIAHEQSISELVAAPLDASPAGGSSDEDVRRHLHEIAVARAIRGQLVSANMPLKRCTGRRGSLGADRQRHAIRGRSARGTMLDQQITGKRKPPELPAGRERRSLDGHDGRGAGARVVMFEPDEGTGRPV